MKASALGFGILLASSGLAQAQQPGFDADTFRPMPNMGDHYITNISARPTPHGQFTIGLFGGLADSQLLAVDASNERVGEILETQIAARLLASVSLWDRFELGLDVPMILSQDGDAEIQGLAQSELPQHEAGIGDIRIIPRINIFSTETMSDRTGFSLGLAVPMFLPTGDQDKYQGGGKFRFEPRLLIDAAGNMVRFSANVGYMVRDEITFRNLEVKNAINYGAALDIALGSQTWHLVPEITGAAAIAADSLDAEETPLEATGAIKFLPYDGALAIMAGGGAGIIRGFGSPDYRAFAGIEYRSIPSADPDNDGLIGDADNCPTDPEDKDGFKDTDGCPDLDNDEDGVADTADKCPLDPEDKDGFEDENGCPDPDNDGDGILDAKDKCPVEAEDKDGFEDDDGCIDADNDGDKVLDKDDKCPINAEDIDQFEDADGCPDPDNDNDGILDANDKCPLKKEVFNGVDDNDGCPDEGGKVKLTCEEIKIDGKVYFASGKSKIKRKSLGLLGEVASVLKSAKFITKMRVEGHTDDRGRDSFNKELSQKRADAVRTYLISQGVEASRLDAVGFGEERPISSNKTRKGRAENRRVQFVVVERSGECK